MEMPVSKPNAEHYLKALIHLSLSSSIDSLFHCCGNVKYLDRISTLHSTCLLEVAASVGSNTPISQKKRKWDAFWNALVNFEMIFRNIIRNHILNICCRTVIKVSVH